MLVDFGLYLIFPYDNIYMVPLDSDVCMPSVDLSHSLALGCSYRGSGTGYTKVPSFMVTQHENMHANGYREPMAFAVSSIITILYINAGYWFVLLKFGVEI
jgi:hypothetical protein